MNGRFLQLAVVMTIFIILTGFFLRSSYILRQNQPLDKVASLKIDEVVKSLQTLEDQSTEGLDKDPFHLLVKQSNSSALAPANNAELASANPETDKAHLELVIGKQRLKVRGVFISRDETGAMFSAGSKSQSSLKPQSRGLLGGRNIQAKKNPQEQEFWVPVQGEVLGYTLVRVEPGGVWLSAASDQEPVLLKIFSQEVIKKEVTKNKK